MRRILLTGASGYVGGRLLHRLESRSDIAVRCLARDPKSVHPAHPDRVEVVQGDLLDKNSLAQALRDCDAAYFLVHALGSAREFEQVEMQSARNFAEAAKSAGVKKIIYLGGLGQGVDLSAHLRTRHEVGQILAASVPTLEFRASIIIGSGSLSFELLRALTEKLPVMVTPQWLHSVAQPIAIEDVLRYLIAALDRELSSSELYEIGGPDRVTYLGLVKEYARQRNLRRWYLPVPVLTPYLSSLWLGLVTPVYARVGRKLIDSLLHDTIVTENSAETVFSINAMGYSAAISRALLNEDLEFAETRWSDAQSATRSSRSWGGARFGSRLVDTQTRVISATPEQAFLPIVRIGGDRGWYFANFLWHLRGLFDLAIGGVGMRRGRRHPFELRPGDTVDFWRVESIIPNSLLIFVAEMKVPGRAWLQFEVRRIDDSQTKITQTAIFEPLGLWGLAYWYILYPIHAVIFRGMLRGICHAAMKEVETP